MSPVLPILIYKPGWQRLFCRINEIMHMELLSKSMGFKRGSINVSLSCPITFHSSFPPALLWSLLGEGINCFSLCDFFLLCNPRVLNFSVRLFTMSFKLAFVSSPKGSHRQYPHIIPHLHPPHLHHKNQINADWISNAAPRVQAKIDLALEKISYYILKCL